MSFTRTGFYAAFTCRDIACGPFAGYFHRRHLDRWEAGLRCALRRARKSPALLLWKGCTIQRRDVAVLSISTALAAIVIAAVTFSVVVLDHTPSSATFGSESTNSSLFVVTWGPSLCRVQPSTVGCASGHVEELGRTWVLHGLWPQPRENQYCNVPKAVADRASDTHGSDMPSVELPEDVRKNLQPLMSDAEVMASHEWYAHGTCSGVTPAVYFGDAVALTVEVRKILAPVFEAGIRRISASAVRELFDEKFGTGAGRRVGLTCSNVVGLGTVIFEVQVSLPPVVDLRAAGNTLSLADVLAKGPPIREGCRDVRVP